MKAMVAVLLLALCFSCCADAQDADPEQLLLIIESANTGRALEGASLKLLEAPGNFRDLGSSNSDGEVKIEKGLIFSESSMAVVICREHFFCGAVLLDDEGKKSLEGFDEWPIALAPFSIH